MKFGLQSKQIRLPAAHRKQSEKRPGIKSMDCILKRCFFAKPQEMAVDTIIQMKIKKTTKIGAERKRHLQLPCEFGKLFRRANFICPASGAACKYTGPGMAGARKRGKEEVQQMAKCSVCGKGVSFGIKLSHSHRRSNRMWKPNVKRVKAVVDGSPKMVYACTRCLRSGKVTRAM